MRSTRFYFQSIRVVVNFFASLNSCLWHNTSSQQLRPRLNLLTEVFFFQICYVLRSFRSAKYAMIYQCINLPTFIFLALKGNVSLYSQLDVTKNNMCLRKLHKIMRTYLEVLDQKAWKVELKWQQYHVSIRATRLFCWSASCHRSSEVRVNMCHLEILL